MACTSRSDILDLLQDEETVDLTHTVLSKSTARLVADRLPNLTKCKHLKMEACYLGDWCSMLSDALPFSSVLSLDLSTNYIGERGAEDLSRALPKTHIDSLNLWSNGIGDVGLTAIGDVLPLTRITSLNLRSNRITRVGMKRFARNVPLSNLTCIILRNNTLTDGGVVDLVKNLHMSSVQILILEGVAMKDKGLLAICAPQYEDLGGRKGDGEKKLPANSWLKGNVKEIITGAHLLSLDVSFNQFTTESIMLTGENLVHLNLTSLNLRNCFIDDLSVRHLANGMRESVLTTLVLEGNNITSLTPFLNHLSVSSLTSLNVARNQLVAKEVEPFLRFLSHRKDSQDADKVKSFEDYQTYQCLDRCMSDYVKEAAATHLKTFILDDGKVEAYPPPNPVVIEDTTLQQTINDSLKKMK